MNPNDSIAKVMESIIPSAKEELSFSKTVSQFLQNLSKIKICTFILGGSGAKGTWLRGEFDVDVFARFDSQYASRSAELADLLEPQLKKFIRVKRVHGSRDYFEYRIKGQLYEIIPILKISRPDQAQNLTDISPLHVKWVQKHRKLRNETRLVKAFMKSARVYGAESYIKGYSGYVAEILTVHFGSFLAFLSGFPKLKEGTVIDISKWFKTQNDAYRFLNRSKLSPLIVLDPLQKERNAAAALGRDQFLALQQRCGEFLSSPSLDFFVRKKIVPADLKASTIAEYRKVFPCIVRSPPDAKITILSMKAKLLDRKRDIAASKLQKALEFMAASLKSQEYSIYDWNADYEDEALAWIVVDPRPLSPVREMPGPPISLKQHVAKFKRKHKSTFIRSKRIFARQRRQSTLPREAVMLLLKHPYVKNCVRSITLL